MSRELVEELRRRQVTDVDRSTLARALYSGDASLYRVVPEVVVRPRHTEELLATVEVARDTGVPLTMRGAGTSIAGNAVGPGIVVDCARHLNRIIAVSAEERSATVAPGVVHAALQREAARHGLRFGPDPSTHTRCTVGGMIGNNACGSRALGYGRTADNVLAVTAVLGTGEVVRVGADLPSPRSGAAAELIELAGGQLAQVRGSFGRFRRQVSGYGFEHLLPEQGRRVDRFLVGSEGTLGVTLEATVALVPEAPARLLLLLGYPSMAEAADAVPAVLAASRSASAHLVACEGLDSRLIDLVRAGGRPVPRLPRGAGWLFAEVTGTDLGQCRSAATGIAAVAGALEHRMVTDAAEAAVLWRIREDGAGLASRSFDRPAHSGWEDAAVPPELLGDWLRAFEGLLAGHGLSTVPYGHFGDGCLHARIDFTFDDAGRRRFREFLVASATALRGFSGSLSGEHGDGRARSELLPLMYDRAALQLFAAAKAVCDPQAILNPGVLVDPAPFDADLRPGRPRQAPVAVLRLPADRGSFAEAVHRCTGVGRCVAPEPGGVMCPSFQASREEKDSTRGRARVLQEALDGSLVHGLSDPAVHQALDLCLACKGCATDCPTGVDLAAYKSEVLAQTYAGRRRPRSHYWLGRLPRWLALVGNRGGTVNRLLRRPGIARLARAAAGVDQRRSLPELSDRPVRAATRASSTGVPAAPDVWIWADTFTNSFGAGTARAAIEVLSSAGLASAVIPEPACCGLTWTTTGQLETARRHLAGTVDTLAQYLATGAEVLALEPSCLASLRSDAAQLVDDPRVGQVAEGVLSLAELLEKRAWQPPDLSGTTVVAQPHCHHASVIGWAPDERLLSRAGAEVIRVPGCCGLAGSFGMERGHYEHSVAVAETHLLPAVRAHPQAVVLADGMSCRHQLSDLAGVSAMSLAELFAARLRR